MARDLAPGIYFVRSNGGSGSYPVTPEGWKITRTFIMAMIATAIVAAFLAFVAPVWLWVAVLVIGFGGSAWWFIMTARKHTDFLVTYNEYMKNQRARA
jgi:hypothetical protein